MVPACLYTEVSLYIVHVHVHMYMCTYTCTCMCKFTTVALSQAGVDFLRLGSKHTVHPSLHQYLPSQTPCSTVSDLDVLYQNKVRNLTYIYVHVHVHDNS